MRQNRRTSTYHHFVIVHHNFIFTPAVAYTNSTCENRQRSMVTMTTCFIWVMETGIGQCTYENVPYIITITPRVTMTTYSAIYPFYEVACLLWCFSGESCADLVKWNYVNYVCFTSQLATLTTSWHTNNTDHLKDNLFPEQHDRNKIMKFSKARNDR